MPSVPKRLDESECLQALQRLEVLDTEPEAEFDALVQVASRVCGVPISLISLVDGSRQWFKANVGLPGVAETPREVAFCAHAVLGDALFEVADALQDERFANNPLVVGRPDIRFYAGAPLRLGSGHNVGTLCVIDQRPRQLDDGQREVLRNLAVAAVAILEGRQAARELRHAATDALHAARDLALAHQRMALATDSGGIGLWSCDPVQCTTVWDARACSHFDLPASDQPRRLEDWLTWVIPADSHRVAEALQVAMDGRAPLDIEFGIQTASGVRRWLRLAARTSTDADDQGRGLLGACWNVTDWHELNNELAEKHETLRVTLQSIGDAVITTDAGGRVAWMNPVAERMTGWLSVEARGRPLAQVFHIVEEETRLPAPDPVVACIAKGQMVGLAHRTLLISRNGTEFGIEDSAAPMRNDAGDMLGVVLVFHDVSEQRRLSSEMTYRATHDALTGLVNRAEFEARLLRVLRKAHDDHSQHALLYIDLDQFKLVNDACGHTVGDQLLQQMGKLLTEAVRARDTLARLGGDEFGIILEHCTVDQAQRVAQKICDRMEDFRFVHDDRRFRIGTSIGLIPVDRRWATTAAIQQAADSSCYAAKEAGRNRVHAWFDTDVAMQARRFEMDWTTRIERALDEDRFVLFAQRIHPLQAEEPGLHAEVLLRLAAEDGTLVLPGAFLPAAERFHLATRIDRWVLKQVVLRLQRLPALAPVFALNVNLSGQSVGDRAFHGWALELLEDAGPAICARICLEVTETAAVTNLADAAHFIEQVRAAGVKVSLDDFGAGASSFGYLKTLPVDSLKIDGQFIRDLVNDSLDEAAVRCFVDVAKVVNVKTVAECVEQPAVLDRLLHIGVDYAQGFLVHRPSPLDDMLALSVPAERSLDVAIRQTAHQTGS